MNTYQKGVSDAIGIECNVGTPDQLFYPQNFMDRVDSGYIQRRISTIGVANLCNVDPSTVWRWRKKGWLNGKKSGKRVGGRKWTFWRHSLKDIEDCLMIIETRKQRDNPVEHKTWTEQEKNLLLQGHRPEYRSPRACRTKLCRIKKEQQNKSHT